MHCLPQTFFETFSSGGSDPGEEVDPGSEEKIQELLILAFEVIVQPPKHTLEIGIFFAF